MIGLPCPGSWLLAFEVVMRRIASAGKVAARVCFTCYKFAKTGFAENSFGAVQVCKCLASQALCAKALLADSISLG